MIEITAEEKHWMSYVLKKSSNITHNLISTLQVNKMSQGEAGENKMILNIKKGPFVVIAHSCDH